MKTLLLLITVLFLGGCTFQTTSPFIITGVEVFDDKYYKIEVNRETYMFTKTLYSVGDTLK